MTGAPLPRRLVIAVWAAVVVTALLLPLATVLIANGSGPGTSDNGPSAEEASVVLGGVQRLLHSAVSLRVDGMIPPPSPDAVPIASAPHDVGRAGPQRLTVLPLPIAATECRLL